jgi:hypothetical protein
MKGLQSFYRSFYGKRFYRHFRRPDEFINENFRIQFKVETPKQLYLHVHRNSGTHPCLIHTYDYGSRGNLNKCNSDKMVFDRVFFDFDVSNNHIKKVKNQLVELRSQGPGYEKDKQVQLKDQLQKLILEDEIAKPAIEEAKDFSHHFKDVFGKYPALFFSGCKGCHAYAFFNQFKFINLNRAVSWFAGHVKKSFNYQTIDLAVTKDAQARLSRVPYSKHQLTGLAVIPFTVEDKYEVIIEKALAREVESFYREDFITDFHLHLQEIDKIEAHNAQIKENVRRNNKKQYGSNKIKFIDDHRVFFKSILGDPVKEYPEKEYVMYNCPFPGHDDKKPSFRVHRCGYYCYGCLKKGNYWQFLKDCYGWSDEGVKKHLNSLKKNNIH